MRDSFYVSFILKDLIIFGASFAGAELPELPEFDMGTLLTVLAACSESGDSGHMKSKRV